LSFRVNHQNKRNKRNSRLCSAHCDSVLMCGCVLGTLHSVQCHTCGFRRWSDHRTPPYTEIVQGFVKVRGACSLLCLFLCWRQRVHCFAVHFSCTARSRFLCCVASSDAALCVIAAAYLRAWGVAKVCGACSLLSLF
jgi:hypothetical protein